MPEIGIAFENVCFSYGRKKILENFSLSIEKGEKVCLFGPSGIGKSTIIRLLCGLEKPNSGILSVSGDKIRPVFQEDRLLPFLTVSENIAMFSDNKNDENIIKTLGLLEAKDEYPSRISGGMARRTAIARALAGDGDVYVLDEPFNGLDFDNVDKAVTLINQVTAEKTVVCVFHSLTEAEKLGCKVIDLGRLLNK